MKELGGIIASRNLNLFYLLDGSGSMQENGKIKSLNFSGKESVPEMKKVSEINVNAKILIRTVVFSTGAKWINNRPIPLEQFTWTDIGAEGLTDMGQAFSLVADQLQIPPMSGRELPPVIILVSDGQPTDKYEPSLDRLLKLPYGYKAIRLAIAIGQDADTDMLKKFIANPEIEPFKANNHQQLVDYFKYASTEGIIVASAPPSQVAQGGKRSKRNVPIIMPPPQHMSKSAIF